MIKPRNCDKTVDTFFEIFNDRIDEINENHFISVTKRFTDMPVPYALQKELTLRDVVKEYFDLNVMYFHLSFHFISLNLLFGLLNVLSLFR